MSKCPLQEFSESMFKADTKTGFKIKLSNTNVEINRLKSGVKHFKSETCLPKHVKIYFIHKWINAGLK